MNNPKSPIPKKGEIPATNQKFGAPVLPRMLVLGVAALGLTQCGGPGAGAPSQAPQAAASTDPAPLCLAVKAEPPPRLLKCSVVAGGAAPRVDDFDDRDLFLSRNEQRVGRWYSFTDETAGCATLSVEPAEAGAGSNALHFTGGGFLGWGAGFGTAFAWSEAESGLCTYDASTYSGIRFRARGSGNLRVHLASRASTFQSAGGDCPDSEGCHDQPGSTLALTPEFATFEVSFCSLTQLGFGDPLGKLDATQLANLNFVTRTKGDFEVWLDDLEFIPWREGQSRACAAICPSDELPAGIRPRPGETNQTGVRVSTFEQPTRDCGPITRRYLSYVPKTLPPKSDAPVVIALHGSGADAETMRQHTTVRRFEALADRDGFVVAYGNAASSAATVAELPNGGSFRKDRSVTPQVDDFAYLELLLGDLAAKGTISGKNPLFLVGLSDGGGLTHMAALEAPTRFQGIAEIMPYPGPKVALPKVSAGFALKRVLVAYSEVDPGMPAGYSAELVPLGPAWAAALGLGAGSPRSQLLPDRVQEGAAYRGSAPNAKRTGNSRARQLDYGTDVSAPQVRVLSFDRAGHLWPVANPPDREQEVVQFGLRNRDLDMSDAIWEFFRTSLPARPQAR